jgi:hypothetical protein
VANVILSQDKKLMQIAKDALVDRTCFLNCNASSNICTQIGHHPLTRNAFAFTEHQDHSILAGSTNGWIGTMSASNDINAVSIYKFARLTNTFLLKVQTKSHLTLITYCLTHIENALPTLEDSTIAVRAL